MEIFVEQMEKCVEIFVDYAWKFLWSREKCVEIFAADLKTGKFLVEDPDQRGDGQLNIACCLSLVT